MTAQSSPAVALEPCPFCGDAARTYTSRTESLFSHDKVKFLTIICDNCDILMTSEQHDEIRERWNRRAALPPSSGWQPIETAPKTGKRIMGAVWCPEDNGRPGFWRQFVMFWNDVWGGEPIWQFGGLREHPTHWQPLPPPPSKEG